MQVPRGTNPPDQGDLAVDDLQGSDLPRLDAASGVEVWGLTMGRAEGAVGMTADDHLPAGLYPLHDPLLDFHGLSSNPLQDRVKQRDSAFNTSQQRTLRTCSLNQHQLPESGC